VSELRKGIAFGLVAATLVAGCGKSNAEPSPSITTVETSPPGLRVDSCSTLGAFVFSLDSGDKAAACSAAADIKAAIDGKRPITVVESTYLTLFGACLAYPLQIKSGGEEFIGVARPGQNGEADVVATKPTLPKNAQIKMGEHVLQQTTGAYQTTINGITVSVAVLASPTSC
jgi:hypothetical protein